MNSNVQNRTIRRAKDKTKQKTIMRLVGKMKVDKRTRKNLEKTFSFLAEREDREFTGPELVRRGMRGSIAYDLLDNFERGHIIEKAGEKPSSGRGTTKIYKLTVPGKIVSAFVTDDMNLLISALQEILKKEVNPIKCFCLEAFIKNYGNKTMQSLLENSINRAQNVSGKGFTIDQFMFELIQNTFTLPPPKEEEQEEWLRKNAELMDKSPHRDYLFLYFKSQIENNLLATLEPEELKLYVEDLKEEANLLHLPCRTPSGFKVLKTNTFRDIDKLLAECKP